MGGPKHENLEFITCNYVTKLHVKVGCKLVISKTLLRPAGATHSDVGRTSDVCLD